MIGTSDDWGVRKPDPAFFRAVAAVAPCAPGEITYVGDRIDNDLKPARAAGMRTVFIRRGPWGYIWENRPGPGRHSRADRDTPCCRVAGRGVRDSSRDALR